MSEDRLGELAARLDAIGEELADMGRALLGEAVRAELEQERADLGAQEKRLARARRAVVKAAAILAGGSADDGGGTYY